MTIHIFSLTLCLCLAIYYSLRLIAHYLCYKSMKFGVAQICAILCAGTIMGMHLMQYTDTEKVIFEICIVAITSAMVRRIVLYIKKEF